ncbi:suppressor of lurcher protein 1-like [Rhipicephalus microplus]|uniref:suppressor of lurcher protein 1-like n=1 Tax=Rhipicephalus microplus TaxID=6941 RepID=UPI003F6C6C9D
MLAHHQGCYRTKQMAALLLVLITVHVSILIVTDAVNPGCSCVLFDSMYGKEHGIFTSPNWPTPYERNTNCLLYTFVGEPDDIVELTFDEFDVQKKNDECLSGDFVRLFLHLNETSVGEATPWNSVLCGTEVDIEQVHYSAGQALVFEFHSDGQHGDNTGFRGTYRFIKKNMYRVDGAAVPNTTCSYRFASANRTEGHGHFYSPLYPSTYPKNVRCLYSFVARFNERVRITFEKIRLQQGDYSCLTSPDTIVVYDGKDLTARVIAQFCNTHYFVELLSTGPDIMVEFVSQSLSPGQGFKASYHFEEELHYAEGGPSSELLQAWLSSCASTPPSWSPVQSLDSQVETTDAPLYTTPDPGSGCDQLFSSTASRNGTFSSPGYPDGYPADTRCTYHFSGEGIERAQVVFLDFDLYQPDDSYHTCEAADAVTVFVSINGQRDRVDSFCGSDMPNQVMSTGRNLTLEFRSLQSPGNSTARGFRAAYQFVTDFGIASGKQDTSFACGFAYNSSDSTNGSFASPNWPGIYPRDTECHYFFYGLPGEKVFIEFAYFDIEGLPPCTAETASDYVEFSSARRAHHKIPRHCGMQKPPNIESEGEFFRVTFRTNDRFDGTGFSAQYQFRSVIDPYTIKRFRGGATYLQGCTQIIALIIFVEFLRFVGRIR